jgi:hypothetical protein
MCDVEAILQDHTSVLILAGQLFPTAEEVKQWYDTPNEMLFGSSPREVVFRGDGKQLIEWLSVRAGKTPGAAF